MIYSDGFKNKVSRVVSGFSIRNNCRKIISIGVKNWGFNLIILVKVIDLRDRIKKIRRLGFVIIIIMGDNKSVMNVMKGESYIFLVIYNIILDAREKYFLFLKDLRFIIISERRI